MSNENVKKAEAVSFKDTSVVEKICCFAWFFAQVIVTSFFLLGLCQVNGQTVSVLTFLNNIIDIFSLQWSMFYYYASSCAQGVLYLVVLILLIVKFVRGITYWTNSTYRKTGLEESFKETFKLVVKYMLLSFAFNQVRFTSYATIALVLIFVSFVVLEGLKVLTTKRKPTVLYLISRFGYAFIVCALAGFVGVILCRNSIENIWNGTGLLFGYLQDATGEIIIQTLYTYIVKDVFYLVMLFVFFGILEELASGKTVLGIGKWKALLTISAVFASIDLIIYFTFIGEIGNDALESIFAQLKTQSKTLSILFFSIAGLLTGSYPLIKRYAPKKETAVVADTEKEDEENEQDEQKEQPAPQPVAAPVVESASQPVATPVVESVPQPVAEPVVESVPQPVVEMAAAQTDVATPVGEQSASDKQAE